MSRTPIDKAEWCRNLQGNRRGVASQLGNGVLQNDGKLDNEATGVARKLEYGRRDRLGLAGELGNQRDQGIFVPYAQGFSVLAPLLANLGTGSMGGYPMGGGMGAMGGLPGGGMGAMGGYPMGGGMGAMGGLPGGGMGGMNGFPMGSMGSSPMGGLGGYSGGGGSAGVPFGVPLTASIFRL